MLPMKVKRRYAEARSLPPRVRWFKEIMARSSPRRYAGQFGSAVPAGSVLTHSVGRMERVAGRPIGSAAVDIRTRARVYKDLRRVERKVRNLVTAAETRRWMLAPNDVLNGKSPAQAILNGETIRVLQVLARLEEGIYV